MERIRNFSIIAHIDHGKSTLADRFIQHCGGLSEREMSAQVLDSMDLERERGITIKAQSVSLDYKAKDGHTYQLNIIDTPGHVDFSYEVSRSLAACEGALLVVDASQGVEAQSVANCYTAIDLGLEILPILNKMDLASADPDRVSEEIEDVIGIDATDPLLVSAKTGIGVEDALEAIVQRFPSPEGEKDAPLKALIVDSWFDSYVVFPVNSDDYESFRDALDKLSLNDSAFSFEPESSDALGFGFRCGFLGMLHMEIVQERLEREYGLDLITTAPTVIYEVHTTDDEVKQIHNPSDLPETVKIKEIHEPIIHASILVPHDYVGNVITLCIEKRGVQKSLNYHGNQVSINFELPLSEVVLDFFDRLKSVSRGYASFDYHHAKFEAAPLVKLDTLINGDRVDALSLIVHKDQATTFGRDLAVKMKEIIPRQMYDVAIQAAIGNKVIARTTTKALRKNVTAKCYGGDITRKKKLLEKQKAGKKRMKQIGRVEIPQEAFLAVLRVEK